MAKGLLVFVLLLIFIPLPKYDAPTATAIYDSEGGLLAAKVASDGQWRFKNEKPVPDKFKTCILHFEDKRFYKHCGISFLAIARALKQNITRRKVISGASTITMQCIRLGRKNPQRNYFEKIIEMVLAIKLELCHSKSSILKIYADNAPFGNNVVGLDAAAYRYYNKSPSQLSWSESATLAVLPNAPSLIYPGKRQKLLYAKRNRLLRILYEHQQIDSTTYFLALSEPLPKRPTHIPLAHRYLLEQVPNGTNYHSSINALIQTQMLDLSKDYLRKWPTEPPHICLLISKVKTGNLVCYLGNVTNSDSTQFVDCAKAPRSSGSILKPFLYMAAMDAGQISPKQLLADAPCQFGAYKPLNYSKTFRGAVPADIALSNSLNIPFMHVLQEYGITRFRGDLQSLGFSTIQKKNYGLPLIVGGAEITLYDVHHAYLHLVRQIECKENTSARFFSDASIYKCLEALSNMQRPDELGDWRNFEQQQKIAWKTGTSFGNRDAWCVGISPEYVVSVWVGYPNGMSANSLVGSQAAAPFVFEVFNYLPKCQKGFCVPKDLMKVKICNASGHIANDFCSEYTEQYIPLSCLHSQSCPYHKVWEHFTGVAYKKDTLFELPLDMQIAPNNNYKPTKPMITYPQPNAVLSSVTSGSKINFMATAKTSSIQLNWFLDNQYMGISTREHQLSLEVGKGEHLITICDSLGNTSAVSFVVK